MGSGERLSVKDTEDKARIWRRAGLATGQPITSRLPQGQTSVPPVLVNIRSQDQIGRIDDLMTGLLQI